MFESYSGDFSGFKLIVTRNEHNCHITNNKKVIYIHIKINKN